MTLNQPKRWGLIALAILLVIALGVFLWRALREPELVYQGKPVRALVQRAVFGFDDAQADLRLAEALRAADPVCKARIEKELVRCVLKSLNTRDNSLWRPYTLVRTNLPPAIAKVMPAWGEPTRVRWCAVWWLSMRAARGGADSAPPGLFQRAMPVLCDLARNDPNKQVRQVATMALGQVGTDSPEAFEIMLRALESTDPEGIGASSTRTLYTTARWPCEFMGRGRDL